MDRPAGDFLPLNGTDYVELWVGNAKQAAYFYRAAFGFSLVAYRGPETGTRDRVSYVLKQDKIRLVLTTPLQPDGDLADHVRPTDVVITLSAGDGYQVGDRLLRYLRGEGAP